eukprot:4934747-Pleurochrysis_carterae.AAC.2
MKGRCAGRVVQQDGCTSAGVFRRTQPELCHDGRAARMRAAASEPKDTKCRAQDAGHVTVSVPQRRQDVKKSRRACTQRRIGQ